MNTSQTETKRLADAVANIATTIAEIIETQAKQTFTKQLEDAVQREEIGPASIQESWVTKKVVAKYFGVTPRTIDNWMKRELLPHIRMGRNVRFKLRDVDEAASQRMYARWR